MFEDAGKHLLNGDLDLRLLISYYPELGGVIIHCQRCHERVRWGSRTYAEKSVDDISKVTAFSLVLSTPTDFQLYRT